jgi:hypothetical protein
VNAPVGNRGCFAIILFAFAVYLVAVAVAVFFLG